jgi:hypothetical protein
VSRAAFFTQIRHLWRRPWRRGFGTGAAQDSSVGSVHVPPVFLEGCLGAQVGALGCVSSSSQGCHRARSGRYCCSLAVPVVGVRRTAAAILAAMHLQRTRIAAGRTVACWDATSTASLRGLRETRHDGCAPPSSRAGPLEAVGAEAAGAVFPHRGGGPCARRWWRMKPGGCCATSCQMEVGCQAG